MTSTWRWLTVRVLSFWQTTGSQSTFQQARLLHVQDGSTSFPRNSSLYWGPAESRGFGISERFPSAPGKAQSAALRPGIFYLWRRFAVGWTWDIESTACDRISTTGYFH